MNRSAPTPLSPPSMKVAPAKRSTCHRPSGSALASAREHSILAILVAILLLVATGPAVAQEASAEPAKPKSKPCSAPEYRQFDFWLGEWEVWTENLRKKGGPPARSRITSHDRGCVIQEEYTAGTGYSGRSLNYYDKRDGKWHQSWIDNGGNPILQVGGMQGDSMVLDSPGPNGALDRITWTPMDEGKVRQHWTRSKDDGKTWTTVFDGMYHPKNK